MIVRVAAACALAALVSGAAGARPAAAAAHPPVAAGASCVSQRCHPRLLDPPAAAGRRSVHAPASDGDCGACHDLSQAGRVRHLKGVAAGADEGPEAGRAWDLELCGGCHDAALHAREAPPGATGFADGKRNLHALHVQAGRGRRCLPCHAPHAAGQPLLLRERIPARGGAVIAQQFRAEPGGGWCRTGCHAPKGYRR